MQSLVNLYTLLFLSLTFKTVAILILNHTCLFFVSSSKPTLHEALDHAYSLCLSSNTYDTIAKVFLAPPEAYSFSQFTEFILEHRF
jgi:hypothetical protein